MNEGGGEGQKGLRVFRTWCKLSTGLYGYKTVRKVTWTCRNQLFDGDVETSSAAREDLSSMQSGELITAGNFTQFGARLAGNLKRTAEHSLEPRIGKKVARL